MKPFYWALLTAVVWGCVPILEKTGLARIPVMPGIFYRSLGVMLGGLVLLVFKYKEIQQSADAIFPGCWFLVLGGFMASVVGQILFYHALKDGEASMVVPLAGIYPLISFILGILFFGEKLTMAKGLGIFFVMAGILLLK